jgi:hypothetical protein
MASDSLPTPPASVTPTPAAAAAASGSQTTDAPSAAVGALPVPPTAAAGTQPAPTQAEMLESLLQQIVTSNSPPALASTLRNAVGTAEAREEVLAGLTSAGADPLEALDVAQHTIGALFILYVDPSVSLTSLLPPFRRSSLGRTCARMCMALSWILNGDKFIEMNLFVAGLRV